MLGFKWSLSDEIRKPHRQFCSLCGDVCRVDFHVSDEIWRLAVHHSQLNEILCLNCFTRMADERFVDWGKDIKFHPYSLVEQVKIEKL